MTVWNEFLNDARVTKEAETLVQAGYSVTVVAIHTPGKTVERERHASGFDVVRISKRVPLLIRLILLFPYYARMLILRLKQKRSDARSEPLPPPPLTPMRRLVSGIGMFIGSWRMMRAAMRANADIYHIHDANTLLTGWLASRLRSKPFVYDAHEISADREGYRGIARVVHLLERKLMPRAAATITTTGLRADHFKEAYGVRRPTVLQNRPRYQPLPQEKRLRFELGIDSDRFVVLYQGGLQAGRGLHNLVEVAGRIPEAVFVLIGGGRQATSLAETVGSKGMEDRVHIIPTVPLELLPSYTSDADLGVQILRNTCLNHWTTDSNKLFEYIMAGLPVVASDFPEIAKVVKSGPFGLLVDPEDLDDVEAAIRTIMDDSVFREACRARCIESAEQWSWERQEGALLDLYAEISGTSQAN